MPNRRLVRPRSGRLLAGVCRGLAEFFDVDVAMVRLAFVIFGLFGAGEIVYLAIWLIAPSERR